MELKGKKIRGMLAINLVSGAIIAKKHEKSDRM
jgi:hypothetical protein